jgi:Xaa-Pro aminopeptidase
VRSGLEYRPAAGPYPASLRPRRSGPDSESRWRVLVAAANFAPMNEPSGSVFGARRRRVLEALGERGAMVLPAAPEVRVGRDLELRYRVDPELWYLTGYAEPEAVAVLRGGEEESFTLFVRPRDEGRETWTGPRGGVEAALEGFGADAAHPIGELDAALPALLRGVDRIHFRVGGGRQDVQRVLLDTLARGRGARQRTGRGPAELTDPGLVLDEMRLVKEPGEIEAIREAVRISTAAFLEGFAAARPGAGEWEVEAAVEAAMRRAGAEGPAFATIAASAGHATVLHYTANDRRMNAGDLLLLDAGARFRGYHGDLTRTAPVGGRFSPRQRDIYEAVLAARDAAIEAARPGATILDVHHAALRVLLDAMVRLRLVDGETEDLMDQEDRWKRWFPHNTSHWLGLDVHDVGTYAVDGRPRTLQPGMVLTIEPGIYVPAHAEDAPAGLRGIGVRIEDDLLITDAGPDVLSRQLPADPDAVQALLG